MISDQTTWLLADTQIGHSLPGSDRDYQPPRIPGWTPRAEPAIPINRIKPEGVETKAPRRTVDLSSAELARGRERRHQALARARQGTGKGAAGK